MDHQTPPTLALLRQLEADHFLPGPTIASTSQRQININRPPVPVEQTLSKRNRQRISRACDACRRMKIKCVLESNICEACAVSARPCTFEDSGTKRERPPTKKDIQDLNARIKSLEKLLSHIAPDVHLDSLPRTADQARRIANAALSRPRPNPVVSNNSEPSTSTRPLSDHVDVDEAAEVFSGLNICSDRFLGSHLPFFNSQPSYTQSASYDPDLDAMIEDPLRSVTERMLEKRCRSMCPSDDNLPPSDLAHSLISLYFSRVQPFTIIVHKECFLGLYGSGLINRDLSFKALCYSMFATASPYSDDERVMSTSSDGSYDPQTAGARYAASAITTISPSTLPCTLYDLQAMAVLSHFYMSMCTPTSAWLVIGSWLRRAQDVGAHVEEMPRWCTSVLKDQLRKRAFWYLVVCERVLCMALGRTSCTLELDLTVTQPLFITDEAVAELDFQNPGPLTPTVREKFKTLSWESSGDSFLACATSYWELRKLIAPYFYRIWSTSPEKIFVPPSTFEKWNSSKLMISDLASLVDHYIENSVPAAARWDPDETDDVTLVWTAYLHCMLLNIKMMAHRHLLNDAPQEIEVCNIAARSMIDIMDHVHKRGLLFLTVSWSPYKILPAALICLYAACRRDVEVPRAEKLVAWADVHRCINLFSVLSHKYFLAQQLHESLNWLVKVCIEDILSSKEDEVVSNEKKRRRDVDEPLPSEVLLRNIFASNQQFQVQPSSHLTSPTAESAFSTAKAPTSTLRYEPSYIPPDSHTVDQEDFGKILDDLLSLPTHTLYNQMPPPSNLPPSASTFPSNQSVIGLNKTGPDMSPSYLSNNYLPGTFQSDLPPAESSYTSYNHPIPNLPSTYQPNSFEPYSNLIPQDPSYLLGAPPGFPSNYVPPLQLDTSFFNLDLSPSFATVNFTQLPATSSPLINTPEFRDYIYPPEVSQSYSTPPTSRPYPNIPPPT